MNRRDFLKRISKAIPVVIITNLLPDIEMSFDEEIIEKDRYIGGSIIYDPNFSIAGTTLAEREKYMRGSIW